MAKPKSEADLAEVVRESETPNKLHDLKAALDAAQVYSPEQVQQVVELFLGGADRDKLDPYSRCVRGCLCG